MEQLMKRFIDIATALLLGFLIAAAAFALTPVVGRTPIL
jgi:hypothetical protein